MKITKAQLRRIIKEASEFNDIDDEVDYDEYEDNDDDSEYFLHGYDDDAPNDEEGRMAKYQLSRVMKMAAMLSDMLEPDDQLPGWVQDHISVAHENLGQVFSYMEPKFDMGVEGDAEDEDEDYEEEFDADYEEEDYEEDEEESEEEEEELGEAKKGLWANIHARRKAGKKPLKPGQKGYPKTLKIKG